MGVRESSCTTTNARTRPSTTSPPTSTLSLGRLPSPCAISTEPVHALDEGAHLFQARKPLGGHCHDHPPMIPNPPLEAHFSLDKPSYLPYSQHVKPATVDSTTTHQGTTVDSMDHRTHPIGFRRGLLDAASIPRRRAHVRGEATPLATTSCRHMATTHQLMSGLPRERHGS